MMKETTEFNVSPATHHPVPQCTLIAAVMRSLGVFVLLAGLGLGPATEAQADLTFAQTQADLTLVVGQSVNIILPEAKNPTDPSATINYTLTGTNGERLPVGLTFDGERRFLYGMITGTQAAIDYTYVATEDNTGTPDEPVQMGNQTFSITVKVRFDILAGLFVEGSTDPFANKILVNPQLQSTDTIHEPITISYVLTGSGTATPGDDFILGGSGTLTWEAGEYRTKIIDVTVVDDAIYEPDPGEFFDLTFTIANPALATFPDFSLNNNIDRAIFQVGIVDNDLNKDAVEETINSGLAAFGRALGWGDVETVRERLKRGSTTSGMQVSGLPSGGGDGTTLSPDSLLTGGVNLELGLNAAGDGSTTSLPALNAWVGARHSEIDAKPFSGHQQDGRLNSIRGGVDTRLDNDLLVGTGLGWHDGQLDFSREGGEATGAMELDLITVNPYAGYNKDGLTVWGTVGAGTGELDYTEDGIGTLSSDVTLLSGAAGIAFKRDWNGYELTGRGEGLYSTLDIDAATAGDLEIDDLSADVGGLRAEVEVGLPLERDAMIIRPYVSTGLRYDLGDYADDLAYEVGGGLDMASDSFTLSLSGRTQLGSDSFDLSSYALSMAFDRDGDGLGLMLGLDQRLGQTVAFDPFAETLGTPAASGRQLALEAGYGMTLGRGVLMPYGEWQVSGSERTASESGLKWIGRDVELGILHTYGSGGTLAEERHVLGVTVDIGY